MQVTLEAVIVSTNGRPTTLMADVRMQEELQVLAVSDVLVERGALTEVEELLQLGSTVGSIVDINLRVTLNERIINIVVVLGIIQHLLQVMVVSHTHLNGVRVGLTEIGLGIVSEIEAILIPVKRVSGRRVFDTVDMALSVRLLLEQFPSTTRYLVGTWCDVWLANTDKGSWQHNLRCLDVLDERNTALEHDVDVHHMTLTDRSHVCTRCIGLFIVILINDGDNLLL